MLSNAVTRALSLCVSEFYALFGAKQSPQGVFWGDFRRACRICRPKRCWSVDRSLTALIASLNLIHWELLDAWFMVDYEQRAAGWLEGWNMTRDVYDVISRKLRELEDNLLYLKPVYSYVNKSNLKEDMIRYWGIERGIQICIECVIDIGDILVSVTATGKPSTYRETMIALAQMGVIPEAFSKKLSRLVGFRNVLVHDYAKIDAEMILHVLENELDDFVEFMKYVNAWMTENWN